MSIALITGVTGQDGTYLSRALLADGVEVHGIVRPGSSRTVESGVVVHDGDVLDDRMLTELVAQLQPDELYHLAGQTSVAASWADPVGTVLQTGAPTAALLHAVAESSADTRFVLASSAEIFGRAPAPQNETTPIAPLSPYGSAKALAHHLVGGYRERGVHASSCILYNHESPLRPERFVTRKITVGAARIARGLQDSITLGNLDAARDWGWAPDVVAALRLAAAHPAPGDYVIGTGELHTVREFVAEAFSAAEIGDWEDRVVFDESLLRPVDPPVQLADSTKARSELGWEPNVTFTEIVNRMVEHDMRLLEG